TIPAAFAQNDAGIVLIVGGMMISRRRKASGEQ
ncbi:EamA-like transporter family protein, partial [Rhizobium ruizarguesonis]